MYTSFKTKNFMKSPDTDLQLTHLNDVSDLNTLKLLYSTIKTAESVGRGRDYRDALEAITENLYWNFQLEDACQFIKDDTDRLEVALSSISKTFTFQMERALATNEDSKMGLKVKRFTFKPTLTNSVFLSDVDVLSNHKEIKYDRLIEKNFGFDDTQLDLAKALEYPLKKHPEFAFYADQLANYLSGQLEIDRSSNEFYFQSLDGKVRNLQAGDQKNLLQLQRLLRSGYIESDSCIFIDDPKSTFTSIPIVRDMIQFLADAGVQFFIRSSAVFT